MPSRPRSPAVSTLLEISKNVASVPSGLSMRTLPACSATNSLPSGANSISVGPASPLATWDWVKPLGTAPWAGFMPNTSKVPTAASKVSAITTNGTGALLSPIVLISPPKEGETSQPHPTFAQPRKGSKRAGITQHFLPNTSHKRNVDFGELRLGEVRLSPGPDGPVPP